MNEQNDTRPKNTVRVRVLNWADMVRAQWLRAPLAEAQEAQGGYRFSNGRKLREGRGAYGEQ